MEARRITDEEKCSQKCVYFKHCGGFFDTKKRCPRWVHQADYLLLYEWETLVEKATQDE